MVLPKNTASKELSHAATLHTGPAVGGSVMAFTRRRRCGDGWCANARYQRAAALPEGNRVTACWLLGRYVPARQRTDQAARVVVLRRRQDSLRAVLFHHHAVFHHQHVVADEAHHRQVVADEDVGQP
jgi:hypothetical protein